MSEALSAAGWVVFAILLGLHLLQVASIVVLAVPPLHRKADTLINQRRWARRED